MIDVSVEYQDDGRGGRSCLKVVHNGKVVMTEYDGGEPEDQSFDRDWSWVPMALKEMYELGLKDGAK